MDLFSTHIAHAASKNINQFIGNVDALIINPLILFLFSLALVYFLYGVFEFIVHGNNDEKKTIGKTHMLWGVVGITIMMSVWALLGIILNTLEISDSEVNPEQGTVHLPDYHPTWPPR